MASVAGVLAASGAAGQRTVDQLHELLADGDIIMELITGTGGSSGLAIEGYLVNRGPDDHNIDVHLGSPLYLSNSGKGQNMVVTQVYGRDGRYLSDGTQRFVRLTGNGRTPIVFVAYCADFDKDNPSRTDLFSPADMPPEISRVVRSITEVEQANTDVDLTVPAQLALWVAQGTSLDAISERFPFSQADLTWMDTILQGGASRSDTVPVTEP